MKAWVIAMMGAALWVASPSVAEGPKAAKMADIVILGEVHDNPNHHATQAEWVRALSPAALVFEMIDPELAAQITPAKRTDQATLADALSWEASGWPDFAMYWPIFDAAPTARIYGAAVSRTTARRVMSDGIDSIFVDETGVFGLHTPLPRDEQDQREALQFDAHCGALPKHMLPQMVDVQRLRDATLARIALKALKDTSGPIVIITGNGHARKDWGIPRFLARAAPTARVFVLVQGEEGSAPNGEFDAYLTAKAPERGDPCAAFR